MTKPAGEKNITIKINGKKQTYMEEPAVKNGCQENQLTIQQDLNPDNRNAGQETAVSKEQAEESFEWILPEPTETAQPDRIEVNPEAVAGEKKSHLSSSFIKAESINKSTLKSITAAVLFAVLIGTGFGFLMLKLVILDNEKPKTVEKAHTTPTARVTPRQAQAQSPVTAAVMPSLNAYVVQKGVFSTPEAVREVSRQMMAEGLPVDSLETSGKYFLFLGVTDSMEDAKNLGNYYQTKGTADIYPKNVTIPEKRIAKMNGTEKKVLESTIRFFQILAKATSNGLVKGAIPSQMLESISTMAADLKKIDEKGVQTEKVKKMKTELSASAQLTASFQQGADPKMLLKAQQHLLTFLSLYNSL